MNEILINLLTKKMSGELSPVEEQTLRELLADEKLREEATQLEAIWHLTALYKDEAYEPDVDAGRKALQMRLDKEKQVRSRRILWQRLAAAAVFLLLVVGGYYFGPLEKEQMLSVQASKEAKTIRLPDGSRVRLSPASSLTYPGHFEKERRLTLKGEAFFEVAKSAESPFIVSGHWGEVRVLGTRFLYRTQLERGEEQVLLEEGRVSYRLQDGTSSFTLKAGEAVQYHLAQARVEKTTFNPNDLFWQTGRLVFRGVPLSEILDELEKIFEVQFDRSEIESLLACRQTLAFSDEPALEDVLKALQTHLHWEMRRDEQGVWHLKGGNCQ